jgi:hypothetical protein
MSAVASVAALSGVLTVGGARALCERTPSIIKSSRYVSEMSDQSQWVDENYVHKRYRHG